MCEMCDTYNKEVAISSRQDSEMKRYLSKIECNLTEPQFVEFKHMIILHGQGMIEPIEISRFVLDCQASNKAERIA